MTTQNTIESKGLESFKIGDVVSAIVDIYEGGESKCYCKGNPFIIAETYVDDHGKQHVTASHEHQFVAIDYIEKSL